MGTRLLDKLRWYAAKQQGERGLKFLSDLRPSLRRSRHVMLNLEMIFTEYARMASGTIALSDVTSYFITAITDKLTREETVKVEWWAIRLKKQPIKMPAPERLLPEGQGQLNGRRSNEILSLWEIRERQRGAI